MVAEIRQLLQHIETTRERMIFLASSTSITDHQVVQVSTELDNLINRYFILTKKQ
ncbi:aspartyl-phosphate phosphatase Spo0E family protein [Bacillus testis]|uniref:aspartyl-phosphate phosphatase Spo0E family protein n=1 Tax=Bacillus testis TaxID=1622072 RepID=UPI00094649F7|nr:aspartyl-phosphate phosphatase Spo0E family protein [Bacillus testis]